MNNKEAHEVLKGINDATLKLMKLLPEDMKFTHKAWLASFQDKWEAIGALAEELASMVESIEFCRQRDGIDHKQRVFNNQVGEV